MKYLTNLKESIIKHYNKDAFYIDDIAYTYKDFALEISKIRQHIAKHVDSSEKLIGLIANDDIQTYASMIALWLEGKAYVPVNHFTPIERNIHVFNSTETKTIIDSSENSVYTDYNVIASKTLEHAEINLELKPIHPDDIAYMIFTSGTTGLPKGVPITYTNLNGIVDAMDAQPDFNLMSTDKCLQMFELTFDFSIATTVFPLIAGSCIYTIPKKAIKYFYIYKLIKEQNLTVLAMVPSILNYLRPYFSEINSPHVRYCCFGGGALYENITKEWSNCIPNSTIFNGYGPTEFTVYSHYYKYDEHTSNKTLNGIISIGSALKNTGHIIVDKNNKEVPLNTEGELYLAGLQMTPGYWKNPERNALSFINIEKNGKTERYYKTGDLCIEDEDGDFLYIGRVDFQVKIRGFRVELAEIEFHAKAISKMKSNIVAIDIPNDLGNSELGLAFEDEPFNTDYIFEYMKAKMPDYMIPRHICFIKEFPLSINGKIDRHTLRTHFKKN
ncbi:MAG: AMP-binding protein [Algibacter sp.]|uniref:AMP-binding protein n=1 Tax=Algibacter sp. TaxID=1872428 RepID=UPI00329743AA